MRGVSSLRDPTQSAEARADLYEGAPPDHEAKARAFTSGALARASSNHATLVSSRTSQPNAPRQRHPRTHPLGRAAMHPLSALEAGRLVQAWPYLRRVPARRRGQARASLATPEGAEGVRQASG